MGSFPKIGAVHEFSPYMRGDFVKIAFAQEVTEYCMPSWGVRKLVMGVKWSVIGVKKLVLQGWAVDWVPIGCQLTDLQNDQRMAE